MHGQSFPLTLLKTSKFDPKKRWPSLYLHKEMVILLMDKNSAPLRMPQMSVLFQYQGAEFSSINRIWCDLCFCLFNGLYPLLGVFQWANFSSPCQCLAQRAFRVPIWMIHISKSVTHIQYPKIGEKIIKNTENHRGINGYPIILQCKYYLYRGIRILGPNLKRFDIGSRGVRFPFRPVVPKLSKRRSQV